MCTDLVIVISKIRCADLFHFIWENVDISLRWMAWNSLGNFQIPSWRRQRFVLSLLDLHGAAKFFSFCYFIEIQNIFMKDSADFGLLICTAENEIGPMAQPCVFNITSASEF